MKRDIIFEPLKFRNLTVKNRILRSNTYGNFDNPDGTGTPTRIKWEEKFARGGVGAILSSIVPVHSQGRLGPNCATIDSDERIAFWREVGETVHQHDCKYIVQLSYGSSPANYPNYSILEEKEKELATKNLWVNAITSQQIGEIIQFFANAARRVREAGLDGVEIDATTSGTGRLLQDNIKGLTKPPVNLIAQFLSPIYNQRQDDCGGIFENRVRFLLNIIQAIRKQVGDDFHLQVKVSALQSLEEQLDLCKRIKEAGVDAIHVGRKIPYSDDLSGNFPLDIEGEHVDKAKQIKQNVKIPILCTGGFQTASYIRQILNEGYCDAVTIARALIANNDLVQIFSRGQNSPEKPCTYCEKCRINLIENPLGCYDVSRYDGDYIKMSQEIMSVYL